MAIIDKIRGLFGGSKREAEPTDQQRANREDADRAFDAMNRRR